MGVFKPFHLRKTRNQTLRGGNKNAWYGLVGGLWGVGRMDGMFGSLSKVLQPRYVAQPYTSSSCCELVAQRCLAAEGIRCSQAAP